MVTQLIFASTLLIGLTDCRWVNHQKPPVFKIQENDRSFTFHDYGAYISVSKSEGVEFLVEDIPGQEHGIKDGDFTAISKLIGGETELKITSKANLDREKQEVYKFKIDLKTEDGGIVPGPVWNAEFIVTDENDNPPSIHENSKLHAMEESITKGDSLPEKSFMNNPSNGYIKIVDPDDQDSDSMSFGVDIVNVVMFDKNNKEYTPPVKDIFEFRDGGDKFTKQIFYIGGVPELPNYRRARVTIVVSDCADGCTDGVMTSDPIELTISIQDVNDQKPELIGPQNEVLMEENTPKDTEIFSVRAIDADESPANQITKINIHSCRIGGKGLSPCPYFKVVQDGLGCSSVNDCEGLDIDAGQLAQMNQAKILTTDFSVDFESITNSDGIRKYISVSLIGSNIAAINPLDSDELTLMVYVEDKNEKPTLEPKPEVSLPGSLKVKENMDVHTDVTNGLIKVNDPEGSKVEFILAEEDQPYFTIISTDGKTGKIQTTQKLDREADYTEKEAEGRNTYRIRVKAREIDESPALESQEMIYVIEIEDQNDNGPRIGDATKIEEDEAKNFIYSCASLTETHLMTSLKILDPDRDFSPDHIFHQGGENRQYYNFEPVTGDAPNPLDIRFDSVKNSWGLYSTDEMAQWEANILHEITVIGNDQNIEGTTTISEVNLVICDCNATETETAYCEGFHEAIVGPTTAAMPWWAILIIVLAVLLILVAGLFATRGRQTHDTLINDAFDDEDDVKATLVEYNTEGAEPMEKEDWFRKPRDEMMGEEVMVMPQMGAVTSAKPILPTNLNSTSYLNEAKANADADPSAPPHDSLRTFYYEGQNSDCDLDSICSSDNDYSDNRFDQLDKEFKNVGNLFKGIEA